MSNTQNSIAPISFPPEIWLEILVALRSSLTKKEKTSTHKIIENIVLVSRSHGDLFQPLLFETLAITIKPGYKRNWLVPRLEGLLAFFDCRPQAARWTKSLAIVGWRRIDLRQEEEALLEQVFLRITAIKALRVAHLNITQMMYVHIYRLSGLEDVNIEPVRRNDPLSGAVIPKGGLRIRRLRLGARTPTSASALMQLALSPGLKQLEVGAQNLAESIWSLCTVYPEHSFSSLTSLTTAPPGSRHITLSSISSRPA